MFSSPAETESGAAGTRVECVVEAVGAGFFATAFDAPLSYQNKKQNFPGRTHT